MASTLESARNQQQFQELLNIISSIFIEVKASNDLNRKNDKEENLTDSLWSYFTSNEKCLEEIVSNTDEKNKDTSKTRTISGNVNDIRSSMELLVGHAAAISKGKDKYYDKIVANTEAFVDFEEEQRKGGLKSLFSDMIGNIKSSITGSIRNLFRPKPKTVIIAKASIKDIAGIFKSVKESKAVGTTAVKDKIKMAAASDMVGAICKVIQDVGKAIATGVKAISVALQIFIYLIFPVVLLGVAAIIVVGLYFISKLLIESIVNVLGKLLESISGSINSLITAIAGIYDGIGRIVNTVADLLESIVSAITAPIKLISDGIEKVFNIISGIWDSIKSIAMSIVNFLNPKNIVGKAVSGVTSLFSKENKAEPQTFDAITEPICQTIRDFSDMVKGYLVSMAKAKPFGIIRTNVSEKNSATNRSDVSFMEQSTVSNSSSMISGVSNISRNSSVSLDGRPDRQFNRTNIARFENSYSSSSSTETRDSQDVVLQIKETNSLLKRVLQKLEISSSPAYSLIGD